jgi:predicted NUDIX family NTP pyrophosphohydrolase
MYRQRDRRLEVLLAHPGGPFHVNKDAGHWTIPKGEIHPGDDLLTTARREFEEEIGVHAPIGTTYLPLGSIQQKGGKIVHAWAFAGDLPDGYEVVSNVFLLEWPPKSGREQAFPEVDRAEFFALEEARRRIKPTQVPLLDELARLVQAG